MKQLLIVNGAQTFTSNIDATRDALTAGHIGIIKQNSPTKWEAKDTDNIPAIRTDFWLCYRADENQPVKVIEVDKESLQVTRQLPKAGSTWSYSVTIPTVTDGSTYTIVLIKKGTVPHERNTWTATETVFVGDTTTTANNVAAKLAKYFTDMNAFGGINVSVSVSGATLTFTAAKDGDQWAVKCADDLSNVEPTKISDAALAVGDVAHIKKLASECAANFGFTDTYRDGDTIYPGYPVNIPAGVYVIYTLRFATNRKASKTRDERASQLVHIAVNVGSEIPTVAVDSTPEATYYATSGGAVLQQLDAWFGNAFIGSRGILGEANVDKGDQEVDGWDKPAN